MWNVPCVCVCVCFPVATLQLIRIFPQSPAQYKSTMTCSSPVLSPLRRNVSIDQDRSHKASSVHCPDSPASVCCNWSHLHHTNLPLWRTATTGGQHGPITAAQPPVQPIRGQLSPPNKETKEFVVCQMFVLYLFWQVGTNTIKIVVEQISK